MALDHTHIMEFTDHVVPTEERFSDISDAGSGNYAWLWDNQGQCISHPPGIFLYTGLILTPAEKCRAG